MLLDAAEAGEEIPPYIAPSSQTPLLWALVAVYTQVRGTGPRTLDTLESLERGRRGREEETRRAARARLLQDHKRRDKESTRERSRSRSRQKRQEPKQTAGEDTEWDWVCMCRMCVLHPGKPCATNFSMKRLKEGSREEQGEAEKRRYRLATPRKRSISLQGPIRCTSPHNCRSSATGGCRSQFVNPNASWSGGASGKRSRSLTPRAGEGRRPQGKGWPDGQG